MNHSLYVWDTIEYFLTLLHIQLKNLRTWINLELNGCIWTVFLMLSFFTHFSPMFHSYLSDFSEVVEIEY